LWYLLNIKHVSNTPPVRFQFITTVKTAVLWCETPCIVVYMYQHFRETCHHLLSWWWEQNIPLKCWYLYIKWHDVRFQNTAILIVNLLY
jgi:hypothetical protein